MSNSKKKRAHKVKTDRERIAKEGERENESVKWHKKHETRLIHSNGMYTISKSVYAEYVECWSELPANSQNPFRYIRVLSMHTQTNDSRTSANAHTRQTKLEANCVVSCVHWTACVCRCSFNEIRNYLMLTLDDRVRIVTVFHSTYFWCCQSGFLCIVCVFYHLLF